VRTSRATHPLDCTTPVLILGGTENALSVARNLGGRGVAVRISSHIKTLGMRSRFCRESFPIRDGQSAAEFWRALLLGDEHSLYGHIIFPCSDEALEFLAGHRQELEAHYILDDYRPELLNAMLDKKRTLELARSIGVPTPNFWAIRDMDDVVKIREQIQFPALVKPIHSHKFQQVFKCKFFIINDNFDELEDKAGLILKEGLQIMIVEMIPGPDSLLCSYFTYIDQNGRELYRFTKRVLRRFPINHGGGTYHITEWLPETAELGSKFFQGIEFRGMGNIEFKRDTRDGKLKVIEVNARFVAAQELLVRCGMPIDLIVYCYLTGQPQPEIESYTQFLRMWYPRTDYAAFRELQRRGELTFFAWIRSWLLHRKVLPIFSIRDPWPFVVNALAYLKEKIGKVRRG
jgi:D-aspartate ligase